MSSKKHLYMVSVKLKVVEIAGINGKDYAAKTSKVYKNEVQELHLHFIKVRRVLLGRRMVKTQNLILMQPYGNYTEKQHKV